MDHEIVVMSAAAVFAARCLCCRAVSAVQYKTGLKTHRLKSYSLSVIMLGDINRQVWLVAKRRKNYATDLYCHYAAQFKSCVLNSTMTPKGLQASIDCNVGVDETALQKY